MLLLPLIVVALMMVPLELALLLRLTSFLLFLWATRRTLRSATRFALACGTFKCPRFFPSSVPCFARFRFFNLY